MKPKTKGYVIKGWHLDELLLKNCKYCGRPVRSHEKYWLGTIGELTVWCDVERGGISQ